MNNNSHELMPPNDDKNSSGDNQSESMFLIKQIEAEYEIT